MTTVNASLDATIGEFKDDILQTFFDDELSRMVASVELALGEKPLLDDSVTLADSGISEDVAVLAVLSKRTAECLCKQEAPLDLCDPNRLVLLNIPDGTTEIPVRAFRDCQSVVGVTIPKSVTKIGDGAFLKCRSLISLTMPDSLTEIGRSAFYGCSSLTSLTIPESVREIGDYSFCGCSSLASLTIPESVKRIGLGAFEGCGVVVDQYSRCFHQTQFGLQPHQCHIA